VTEETVSKKVSVTTHSKREKSTKERRWTEERIQYMDENSDGELVEVHPDDDEVIVDVESSDEGSNKQIEMYAKSFAVKSFEETTLFCEIPFTLTDRKRWTIQQTERYVTYPLHIKDLHGGTLVKYVPSAIPSALLQTLCESTTQLQDKLSPKMDQTCRGKQSCYYFGYWRKSSMHIHECPLSKTPPAVEWMRSNQLLFSCIATLLKSEFPHLYSAYQRIPIKYRPFGSCWSFAVINVSCISSLHIDKDDWRNGFCCVLPFASKPWKGGELQFPDLNLTINMQAGDVVFFQSQLLQHGNCELLDGNRNSLVLVSHNDLFNNLTES
jgi:hypothetical protein